MEEEFIREIAAQLRKPNGEMGTEVANRMNEGNREMNLGTIDALEVKDRQHIVEIGMGNGFFVKEILSRAKDVQYTGCDYSEDMVKAASILNAEAVSNGSARFVRTPADDLPFDFHSVDTLFTVNTLYFWEDHSATLSEFLKVLKPDGRLIITIRPGHSMKKYPTTKYNFEYFEREDVTMMLEKNQFSVIKCIEVTEQQKVELFDETFDAEYLVVVARPS